MQSADRNTGKPCPADRVDSFVMDDEHTLVIRPTSVEDAPRLQQLYDALDPDDQRRRFFTAWSPKGTWCQSWASVAERGGFGVVAIVTQPGVSDCPVGEAGYAIRSDGDGDLAVTVAEDWRGWLGAYLVDRLVEHAAAHGVENLQADVLFENTRMRRLLEHRGAVVLDHDGATERFSISTSGHVPSWPPRDDRLRVLVETVGGRWGGEVAAKNAHLALAICRGPTRRQRHGCPVLDGGRCPLADGAQAIVVLLDADDDSTPSLIDAHLEQNPETPVFVRRGSGAPDQCHLLTGESSTDTASILRSVSEIGEPGTTR